ncbi:MAG: helix-turn-helix domain-containing protein, partial [Gemmatimonadaceae bacterium]
YPWPGNVRELRNVLERTVLLSARGAIHAADLSFDVRRATPRAGSTSGEIHLVTERDGEQLTLEELQRRHIIRVLDAVNGRVELAAQRLGVPRSTLYQKLKAMRITAARHAAEGSSGRPSSDAYSS